MKGYKAVNMDGTAMHGDEVYEAGGTYTCEGELEPCSNGVHFCEKCADVFRYYGEPCRVFEVEAVGKVVTDGDKSCTDELKVVRELTAAEVSELSNSGYRNSGHRNSGDCNSGHCNSGHRNSGHCNSGHCNSGDCNSGYRNSGDCNSGDWNSTNFSSGVLCTEEPECLIFDEPSGMTLRQWRASEAARLMDRIEVDAPRWKDWSDLSESDCRLHARLECQGGMLLVPEDCGKPRFKEWWSGLTDSEKEVIYAIPNFDAGKWKQITGIEVDR